MASNPSVVPPVAGTPIWFDNPTPDREAGKEFYSAVFGWGWFEFTTDALGTYSIGTLNGKQVAALVDDRYTSRDADGPKMWRAYFLSDDVEAAAAKCVDLGGKMLRGKQSHGDLGRSIECATSEGAAFILWSGRDTLAGRATMEYGTPRWPEYYTRDLEGTYRLFQEAIGITFKPTELPVDASGATTYTYHIMTDNSGGAVGGMFEMGEGWEELPCHMMVYFSVESCDDAAKLVSDNGGRVCVPPYDMPFGKFAVLEDPQGITFSVLRPNPDWQPQIY